MEYPNNVAYGTTADGESFVIEQTGAGRAGGQAARLVSFFFFVLLRTCIILGDRYPGTVKN